ncbi:MAG TPA: DUF1552 domain-containing protein [Phycisphaerae bacterium]|jgi:hypothetical protein
MSDKQKTREVRFSRRTLLRGAGVAMALPWLESVPVWGADTAAGAAAAGTEAAGGAAAAGAALFPKRLGIVFMANGVNSDFWTASGKGADMVLGKTLAPMESLKTKMNYISGLFNKAATGVGIHPGQTGNLLSGAQLTKGAEVHNAISVDQVLANHMADQTVQPSMVLGCEQPVTGYHETNFSMAYSSHISWQSATTPVPLEEYPAKAFDSLFENKGNQRMKSILDRVNEQAASLSNRVSSSDKQKLDEYLTSVRSVEKRIETTRELQQKAAANAQNKGQPLVMMKRPDNGLPEDIREHMKLMCDIVAMGFQTDKTRVATLLLCRDISGMCYPFLPGVTDSHHPMSHKDLSDGYERIVNYYVSQFAYLAGKLDAMQEGDGTVLDHSCLVFMSNMWSGSKHDSTRVPMLTAGSLGGTLETGRVLDYYKAGDQKRKLCSLYLSLMDRMGVKLDRFGDADARLDGI